ncbi:M23 family metallopeptidase [Halomicronema hongdechloris]|uniref:M23 family metallopeptidase n=1 Tax=Halomicronema hongdechloris TaxID=1209493 RepID=UPI001930FBCC|nr:M23 family metallopeptidase [Halomicronema hongdechloris]
MLLSVVSLGLVQSAAAQSLASTVADHGADRSTLCPVPALSRVVAHRITAGETLDSIAQQYGVLPVTILGMNPGASPDSLRVGRSLRIPPYNGIQVTVSPGQTWQQLADAYRVRADVLFEINGCPATVPDEIFVPGVNWFPGIMPPSTTSDSTRRSTHPLQGYPLPNPGTILTGYGWQPHHDREELVFHSGVTLAAPAETPVLAVGPGVVAFAGAHDTYGTLVVINHQQGLQTRYANLGEVAVTVGQSLQQGASVGRVAVPAGNTDSFLFFEVRSNTSLGWVARDPQDFIPSLGVR